MGAADVVLFLANVVYATSYVSTRLTLGDIPPAMLALLRLVLGSLILVPLARSRVPTAAMSSADRRRIAAMGVLGFAAAFALGHWGIAWSTATNAALLIIIEPVSVILLSPPLLGERLTCREAAGATLALVGAVLVVVNGVPGVTADLVPYWRGDFLLTVAGVAYGSYSLFGREVMRRHDAVSVTTRSIIWGAVAMLPLAVGEWAAGLRPSLTLGSALGVLYLGVVITALGYLTWNWALARVTAPRAAIFLCIQPVVGALLGILLLSEPLTVFTVAGGVLIVGGLAVTVRRGER